MRAGNRSVSRTSEQTCWEVLDTGGERFCNYLGGNVSVFGDTDTTWSSFLLTVWWTESDLGRNGAMGVSAFVKFAQSRSLVPC